MMAGVYDQARALARALRESEEHQKMRALGAKVRRESRLERLLADLRLRQLEVQAAQLQGQTPSKEQVERLQKAAKAVEAEPLLLEYLGAENAYGQMLAEVQQVLVEVFSPDVPGSLEQLESR
jgi:cell fate (sporulation/competence/biofilm development) regulator YlbF (YheA/YmcA/DUF963 family)